ncbi:MAG TPA: hypothetical protein VGE10_13470 [Zeimonas sp.]
MPRFDGQPRAGESAGNSFSTDVLARLMEITRRYCAAPRSDGRPAPCDGVGFEDRLQETLAGLDRGERPVAGDVLRPAVRVHERSATCATRSADGGVLAWIGIDGVDRLDGFDGFDGLETSAVAGQAADELRERVRDRISSCAGAAAGTLASYGPRSFAWMRPSPLPLERAVALMEEMLESLSAPCRIAGVRSDPVPSLGIVYFPQDGSHAPMLLMRACAAMRRARHYRMGYAFYSPILDAAFATPVGIPRQVAHNASRPAFVARPAVA